MIRRCISDEGSEAADRRLVGSETGKLEAIHALDVEAMTDNTPIYARLGDDSKIDTNHVDKLSKIDALRGDESKVDALRGDE